MRSSNSIVDFVLGMYSAQFWDNEAGLLSDHGAQGGPVNLANQLYYPGINDTLGADPNGIPFSAVSMTLSRLGSRRRDVPRTVTVRRRALKSRRERSCSTARR